METVYSEVSADDRDVAAFVVQHLQLLDLTHLPVKMWVARLGSRIEAVLMLTTHPFPSLDMVVANKKARPFMRIMRLWLLAEEWLNSVGVPIIAISINNTDSHFQSLARRFGFEKIGTVTDNKTGYETETLFGKKLKTQSQLIPAVH